MNGVPPTFDTHADDYESQCAHGLAVSGESKEFFARGRIEHLAGFWRRKALPPPTRIADYGCGVGDVTLLLSEFFPSACVVGLDPARRCVERARSERSAQRVSYMTIEEAAQQGLGAVQLVHTNGVVHHVRPQDRPRLFTSMYDLLLPGGLLALFENNPFNPATRLVMARIPFDRDCVPVTTKTTRRLLAEAGFAHIETAYLFYFPHALRGLRQWERYLTRLPLGAQYCVLAARRG